MDIPEILKGEVHLPLTVKTLSTEAVPLINAFYQTSLTADDFKLSQAFRAHDGKIYLELIDPVSGEVVALFVNKAEAAGQAKGTEWSISSPLTVAPGWDIPWLGSPVVIHSVNELEFLDELGVGNTYPTVATDNTLAWKLSTLLNSYRVLGIWVSGTIGELCTGGFKLVYKGPAADAPQDFLLDSSDMVAVVQILHGSQRGYVCLRV